MKLRILHLIMLLLSLALGVQNIQADEHKKDQLTDSALEAIKALGGDVEDPAGKLQEQDQQTPVNPVDPNVVTQPENQAVDTIYQPQSRQIPVQDTETEPASVALPEPEIQGPPAKDVYLVLDNSGSMKKNDPQFLASQAVNEFINRLDDNSRVAIVIFDQNVKIAVPLTTVDDANKASILSSLDQINYKGQFTDSPAAIERAIYNLKSNARDDARKLIVFMTDGIVDTGNANQDIEKARWLKQDLAADAADSEIQIFGIAFTEDADFQLIQSLAQKTDGEYYRALLPKDLTDVFEQISEIINKIPEPEPVIVEQPVSVPEPVVPEVREPPPPPVIIEVPVQPQGLDEEEELRSRMILIALAVLIIAVLIMVLMLIRGGSKKGAADATAQEAYLNDIHGYTNQSSYKLGNKPAMLGRVAGSDKDHLNYIVIPETTIGRRHSLIEYKDFAYWIIDQGSINGTFVNDQMISSETRLKHGDKVRLHKFEFEFVMPEMDDAGMTVISNTVMAANPSLQKHDDEDSTIARGSEPAEDSFDEPDFDLTGGQAEPDDFNDNDDTLMNEMNPDETEATRDETIMLDDDSQFPDEDEDEDATIRPDMVDDEDVKK